MEWTRTSTSPRAGFRFTAANSARAEDVLFACVCLRASISYSLEAAFWCMKAKR